MTNQDNSSAHGTPEDQRVMAEGCSLSVQMSLSLENLCDCPACVVRTLANAIVATASDLIPEQELELLDAAIAGLTKVRNAAHTDTVINGGGNAPTTGTPQ